MKTRLTLLALLGALPLSCKHETPAPGLQPVTEEPVPAPDNLTAEGTLREPDAFWAKVRAGGGAALASSPDTAAGALLAVAGADRRIASLLSGSEPFQIAIGDSMTGTTFAVAMKIRDLAAAQSALADSETATYTTEDVGGMTHLVPRASGESRVAVAFTPGGYLVVASSVAELGTLGAYAARTLPTKPAVTAAFELRAVPAALARAKSKAPAFAAAITGMIAANLRSVLPPEVDAAAFVGCLTPSLTAFGASASDLAEARVDVDADGAEVHAVATLVPKPGDNPARKRMAAMQPVDAAPLLEAPHDAAATILWSDTAAERADDATTIGGCAGKALAPLLAGSAGPSLVTDVLGAWAKGRGDWEVVSIVAAGSVAGAVARTPAASPPDVTHAFGSFTTLVGLPPVQDVIRRLLPLRAGGVETADVPPVGKAQVLMFAPATLPSHGDDAGTTSSGMSPPGVAWVAGSKEVDVGLGLSPKELLAMTHPPVALGSDPHATRAVKALGADASFAAVIRPPGCCAGGGPGAAPMTVGWGRRAGSGWASVSVGDELVGMLVQRAARE